MFSTKARYRNSYILHVFMERNLIHDTSPRMNSSPLNFCSGSLCLFGNKVISMLKLVLKTSGTIYLQTEETAKKKKTNRVRKRYLPNSLS